MRMQIFRVEKPSCKILKTKNCVPFEVQYTSREVTLIRKVTFIKKVTFIREAIFIEMGQHKRFYHVFIKSLLEHAYAAI